MRTRTTLPAVMAFMALTTTGCELLVPIEELRDGGPGSEDTGVEPDAAARADAGVSERDLGTTSDMGAPDTGRVDMGRPDAGAPAIADHYVCPTLETDPRCTTTSIVAAAEAMESGETVAIHSGDYSECVLFTADEVRVFGVGPTRPRILGDTCGKNDGQRRENLFWFTGEDAVVENLHFEEARTENGVYQVAAIYVDAANVTVRDASFHDIDTALHFNGVAQDFVHDVTLERVTIDEVGARPSGLIVHGLRINGARRVTLQDVSMQQVDYAAHGISIVRADRVEVSCVRVATLNGLASYVLEAIETRLLEISDSVFAQGPNVENGTILRLGASNKVEVANAILVNDKPLGTFFTLAGTPSNEPYIVTTTLAGNGVVFNGFPDDYRLAPSNRTVSGRDELPSFDGWASPTVPPLSSVIATCHAFE